MHGWRAQAALEAWHKLLAAAFPPLARGARPPTADREYFAALARPVLDMLAGGAPGLGACAAGPTAAQASPAAGRIRDHVDGNEAGQRSGRRPLQPALLTLVRVLWTAHMSLLCLKRLRCLL